MSRAVLLGTNAYPYLLTYWLELCKRYWYDEVDTIYIAVSEPVHRSTWPWISSYLLKHDKIKLRLTNKMWPLSINEVAQEITEDTIFIPHDDTFIYQSGVVDKCFYHVEQTGEVLTTFQPIYTPGPLVEELLVKRYPQQMPVDLPDGGKGYSFYTNFTFIPKSLFDQTSKDFGEYHLQLGEYDPLLDHTPKQYTIDADTNFKLTLELLAAGAKFKPIQRNLMANLYQITNPIERLEEMRDNEEAFFNPHMGYLHLETMAYHIGGLYWDIDEYNEAVKTRGGKVPYKMMNEIGSKGIPAFTWDKTFKIALIYEFMETTGIFAAHRYTDHAIKELDWSIKKFGIKKRDINKIKKIFHELFWNKYKNYGGEYGIRL